MFTAWAWGGLERSTSAHSAASLPPTDDILVPGVVVTVEPGLYYPERGHGRAPGRYRSGLRPDGTFEVLADYPLDLVLPMKK